MYRQGLVIGIDVGGSWLKATSVEVGSETEIKDIPVLVEPSGIIKVRSRLGEHATVEDFIAALEELFSLMELHQKKVLSIGVSTAGVVDYKGESVTIAANHLKALKEPGWIIYLRNRFGVPVTLINDADAAAIGAAGKGYLKGLQTIGIMPVGTGVGFSIWRNGRRWNPYQMLPLLGSVYSPEGSYDEIASASSVAAAVNHDLSRIFSNPAFENIKDHFVENLSGVICTAAVLYHTDTILIGGGLAEAVKACDYPLKDSLSGKVNGALQHLKKSVKIRVMGEGNTLPLIGAAMLAMGEYIADEVKSAKPYHTINTEIPYDESLMLHTLDAQSIVSILYEAEQKAGEKLSDSLADIAEVAQAIAAKLNSGGRLIYVGAGTSGRLAAIDTVELSCTFGFPRERVYTLIAGGVPDAAIDIESNFEEDASAVPELLLTSVNENDVVIGISVSGTAYYVLSALALAKQVGAYTVFVQERAGTDLSYCDKQISLYSGHEIIAGSTRMKAGTATKKVLNFISTSVMILLGKVYGPYMVEMECINQKLVQRAQHILYSLFGLDEHQSYHLLERNGFDLHLSIKEISKYKSENIGKK